MTDSWDKFKESVEFYNAEGFIPRRDIRNTIADLLDEGDKLKEKAENYDHNKPIIENLKKLYKDRGKKLEAIKEHVELYDVGLYHGDWIRELRKILGVES